MSQEIEREPVPFPNPLAPVPPGPAFFERNIATSACFESVPAPPCTAMTYFMPALWPQRPREARYAA